MRDINTNINEMVGEAAAAPELTPEVDLGQDVLVSEPNIIAENSEGIQIASAGSKAGGLLKAVIKGEAVRPAGVTVEQRAIQKIEERAAASAEKKMEVKKQKRAIKTEQEAAVAGKSVEDVTPQDIKAAEAVAEGGRPGDGFPGETRAAFNYDLYDQEISQTLEAMSNLSGLTYEKVSVAEVMAMAKKTGIGEVYIGELLARARDIKDLPVDTVRAHLTLPMMINDLREASRTLVATPATADNVKEVHDKFVRIRDTTVAAMNAAKGFSTTPAQAMRMAREYRVVLPQSTIDELSQDKMFADALADMLSDKQAARLLERGSKTGYWKDLWMTTYINGMLSATGTHAVNISSNLAFGLWQPIEREVAAFSGDVRNAISILRNKGSVEDRVRHGEGLAGMMGLINGSRDAMSAAWGTLKSGETLEQRTMKAVGLATDPATWGEIRTVSGMSANNYGYDGWLARGLDYYSTFVTLPGRALSTADDAFKTFAYGFEKSARSFREAKIYQTQLLEAGEDALAAEQKAALRFDELINNPTSEIDLAAMDFSHMATFTRELASDSMMGRFSQFTNDHTVAKVVFPFVRTPTWLILESVQRSPFAPLLKQWRDDIRAGGATKDLAIAKAGAGTIAATALLPYVVDGTITGSGPYNPELRKIYLETGWRPYSIRLKEGEYDNEFVAMLREKGIDPAIGKKGDIYVPYAQFMPLAGVLGLAADYGEYARYTNDSDDDKTSAAIGVALSIANLTKELPVFQSTSGLIYALSKMDIETTMKSLIKYGTSTATKFAIDGAPVIGAYSSLLAQVDRFMNNEVYDLKAPAGMGPTEAGVYEAILRKKSRLPGFSRDIPTALNFWGEERTAVDPDFMEASALNLRPSTARDEASAIIAALGLRPSVPDNFISIKGIRVQLTNEQYRQVRMNFMLPISDKEASADSEILGKKTIGSTVKDLIVAAGTSPEFLAMNKTRQQTLLTDIISKYRDRAQKLLLGDLDGNLTKDGEEIIGKVKDALTDMQEGKRDQFNKTIKVGE